MVMCDFCLKFYPNLESIRVTCKWFWILKKTTYFKASCFLAAETFSVSSWFLSNTFQILWYTAETCIKYEFYLAIWWETWLHMNWVIQVDLKLMSLLIWLTWVFDIALILPSLWAAPMNLNEVHILRDRTIYLLLKYI